MNFSVENILKNALSLPAAERAAVADELLHSLDKPDPELDRIWAQEAEARIDASERGEMETVSGAEVFSKRSAS